MTSKCEFCGVTLDVRATNVEQYMSGWVLNRSGGGGHGLSLPKRENRWAHRTCVDAIGRGSFRQARLFSE